MKYSALDIVHYIITYSCEMNMRITNLRLQKLLYFIQQEYLKDYGKPLFFDDICAWKYGPVVPNVYYIYSGYGRLPILNKYESNLPNEIKKYIEKIVDKLKSKDSWDLVNDTHKVNGAWDKIYKNGEGDRRCIPIDLILGDVK